MDSPVYERVRKDISENDVVLYMKGTKQNPQCPFSAEVVLMLKGLGIEYFKDIDVMADDEIAICITRFTNYPNFPQLFFKGEFVGGCRDVRQMFETGELAALLKH